MFDRSLRTIATDPMPAAPALPPFPTDLSQDSVQLRLIFGQDSVPARHGTIRFAASQTPVRPLTGGGPLSVPSGPNTARRFAVFKYDVTETGEVRPGSFEILDSSDREFERAIRDWIERQSFQPATQNCRPVAMTVVQRAGT